MNMKYAKPILILAVFAIVDLTTIYFFKSFHRVAYSIVGGFGIGYVAYTLILLFVGGWLARYIFYLGRIENIKQALILSGVAGLGAGTFYSGLIGVSILLSRL